MQAAEQPQEASTSAQTLPLTPEQEVSTGVNQQEDLLGQIKQQLETALQQAEQANEQHLRARADIENTRRRAQEDIAKAHKFAIESFAESLVPVKDSLEAAVNVQDQTLEALRTGIEITLRQLSTAFEKHRLLEISPAAGERFDPNLHQAISSVPSEQAPNTIVQTLQKGYLIADRVLRPALVTVSSSA